MFKEKKYEKIIKLNAERSKLDAKIEELRPGAVWELQEMRFSVDEICKMLGVEASVILKLVGKK